MTRLCIQVDVLPSNTWFELINELQAGVTTREDARGALAAYIAERRRYQPRYVVPEGDATITPEALSDAVRALVMDGPENGRRAQAVVAGLMDGFAGPERVESGRINDPSRRHPGDVCVRAADGTEAWEKAFEVRDKPVTLSDVQIFGNKCAAMGVHEAAVVAVADGQAPLDNARLSEWSAERGHRNNGVRQLGEHRRPGVVLGDRPQARGGAPGCRAHS